MKPDVIFVDIDHPWIADCDPVQKVGVGHALAVRVGHLVELLTVEIDESAYLLVSAIVGDMGITVEAYAAKLLEIAASEYRDIEGLFEESNEA